MKYKLFFLIWSSILAFLFMIVGVLALPGFENVEIIFWTRTPIETKSGKITWVAISSLCFVILSALAVYNYKKNDPSSRL